MSGRPISRHSAQALVRFLAALVSRPSSLALLMLLFSTRTRALFVFCRPVLLFRRVLRLRTGAGFAEDVMKVRAGTGGRSVEQEIGGGCRGARIPSDHCEGKKCIGR